MEKKVLCENQNYFLSVKYDFRKKINMKFFFSKNLKIIFYVVEEKVVCKEQNMLIILNKFRLKDFFSWYMIMVL